MFDFVIAGGRVHLETGARLCDVAVTGETIAEVADRITAPARRRVDATGLEVLPGLIDPHVHLGLAAGGTISSDDVGSGTRAALFGGVTTVIDFSLQQPGMGIAAAVEARQSEFRDRSFCDYALHANVTDFPEEFDGRLPAELTRLSELGVTSLKIFTAYSRRGMMIPEPRVAPLLQAAAARALLVLVHAEDDAMVNAATDRLRAAGRTAPADFPESRPAEAEAEAIRRVGRAALAAGASVYFVHVSSTAGLRAVEALRAAPPDPGGAGPAPLGPPAPRPASIWAETCPQYLYLTAERMAAPDGHRCIVTPPLRAAEDLASLRDGLARGAIDTVATDHCPFAAPAGPMRSCFELPSGLPGIETRLPLIWNLIGEGAVESGATGQRTLTESRAVELLATNAAKIFGLYPRKGTIRLGSDADLVLFDARARWALHASELHMRTDHSPYEGMEVRGRVQAVCLRGHWVHGTEDAGATPRGSYLPRSAKGRVPRASEVGEAGEAGAV